MSKKIHKRDLDKCFRDEVSNFSHKKLDKSSIKEIKKLNAEYVALRECLAMFEDVYFVHSSVNHRDEIVLQEQVYMNELLKRYHKIKEMLK